MVWLTAASAAVGVAGSLIKGFGQNAAIDAANKQRRLTATMTSLNDRAQFSIGEMRQQTQYAWDKARIAQLRSVEAQNALDQAKYGQQLIANATENYEINRGALEDQFVVQEQLRGEQVKLEQGYQSAKLAADTGNVVGQYMRGINDNALQQQALVQNRTNQMQELQGSLALEEQRDGLEWQLRKLEALEADSTSKATAYSRQGGGNTAKRLSMQAASKLGAIYGQLAIKSQSRDLKMRMLNTAFNTEGATQMARVALNSQDALARMNYTRNRYSADSTYQNDVLKKLTMPSFELGERQYGRELKSLQLQTKQAFQRANTPYRQKEYMDPIKPMAGLAPMSIMPAMQQKQSGLSMFGSAVLAGVGGALKGAQRVKDPTTGTWSTQWM